MLNQLHDEIDVLERLRNEAKAKTEAIIKENVAAALEAADGDFDRMIELLALAVEEQMDSLTTQAFQLGASFSEERAGNG